LGSMKGRGECRCLNDIAKQRVAAIQKYSSLYALLVLQVTDHLIVSQNLTVPGFHFSLKCKTVGLDISFDAVHGTLTRADRIELARKRFQIGRVVSQAIHHLDGQVVLVNLTELDLFADLALIGGDRRANIRGENLEKARERTAKPANIGGWGLLQHLLLRIAV